MRSVSNFRASDVKLSSLLTEFLIKNFYPSDVEIIKDKKRQCEGLDSIFTLNGVKYHCDEKCGVTRINTNLATFSLELSFINKNGDRQDGWFIREDLKNDSYLFIWPDKADVDKPTSIDEIREVEIALVRKEKIHGWLAEHEFSLERLRNAMECMANEPEKIKRFERHRSHFEANGFFQTGDKIKYNFNGMTFCHSMQLVEEPINIIIPRETYRELADVSMVIKA